MAKKNKSRKPLKVPKAAREKTSTNCFEGDKLDNLILIIGRNIEKAKELKGPLPDKIWMKQQFAIGANEVTRVLERMSRGDAGASSANAPFDGIARRAPLIPLQAVLLASDVQPRWLLKHIPVLASSLNVPVIFVKDGKSGCLRLGDLVKLKIAMAIGIKAKDSIINKTIDEVLSANSLADTGAPLMAHQIAAEAQ